MKDTKFIIQHLKNDPRFSKLKQYECFNKLKKILSTNLQNAIKSTYEKNNILYFILVNHIYKMEFNYSLKLIIKLLNTLKSEHIECREIKDVKFFITNKIDDFKDLEQKSTNIFYEEKSKGDFKNLAEDKKIKEIFEDIRNIILKNNNKEIEKE